MKDEQIFNTNRGLVYWQGGDDERILYSAGAYMYAVNAKNGKAVMQFRCPRAKTRQGIYGFFAGR